MALTDDQKAAVRLYCGWSARFHQFDSQLEQALNAINNLPEHLAQITNAINGTPPGLLALLADVDAKLLASDGRLKAAKVGSIELNPGEQQMLRQQGRRYVARLCTILGVERRADVFGSSAMGPGNYVGI